MLDVMSFNEPKMAPHGSEMHVNNYNKYKPFRGWFSAVLLTP